MTASNTHRDSPYPHRHLLGIEGLHPHEILGLLDRAEEAVEVSRQISKRRLVLQGRTQINLFFENSTRTQSSFELAGKRLGADVMNMAVSQSSVKKGETLIDTAATLNAMHPDLLVVRHHAAGAVHFWRARSAAPLSMQATARMNTRHRPCSTLLQSGDTRERSRG